MKRILITAVGGDVATGIVKSLLLEEIDFELFGCDIKNVVPFLTSFKKYYVINKYSSNEYLSDIMEICTNNDITHFFPTTEPEILIANKNKYFFEKNNIKVIINNDMIINIATSKYKTAQLLKSKNINVPKTYLKSEYQNNLEYPVIVKPDFGRGSAEVVIVTNEAELTEAMNTISAPIIQEYVGTKDEEYTVGIFSDGVDVRSISFRRELGRGTMSSLVETVKMKELEDIAKKCADIFNLKGAFNIQLRRHFDRFYIFEINPRISSTVSFRYKLGFKDVIWWLQLVDNEEIGIYNGTKEGIIGIKLDDEQIFYPDN